MRAMSKGRDPVTFHEADPVSLESVEEVFAVCGALLSIAMLSICVECGNIYCLIRIWRKLKSWVQLLRTMLVILLKYCVRCIIRCLTICMDEIVNCRVYL